MSNIIFTKDADTFTFSKGRKFNIYDPAKVNVPVDYSDGGQLYACNKGITEKLWNLVFEKLSATDYSNFDAWFLTIAIGPLNTFTLTDESGVTHTVRLLDVENPLSADGEDGTGFKYSGTIHLREEI